MKIEVKATGGGFSLDINGEEILKSSKLSSVVNKIEEYLKMRFIKDNSGGYMSKIKSLID